MYRWPGGPPYISYGDNMSIKRENKIIYSRQNQGRRLQQQSLQQIFHPDRVNEVPYTTISDTLKALDVPFTDPAVINEPLAESKALESGNAFDLTQAQKLTFKNDQLCWAKGETVNIFQDTDVIARTSVKSPILQLDAVNDDLLVMRTRLGLSTLNQSSSVATTVLPGHTMHMALNGNQAAVTSTDCELQLFDLQKQTISVSHKFPKASLSGFNRISWGSRHQLFYMDNNELQLYDIRAKNAHLVRESYPQNMVSLRDIKSCGDNIYVLDATCLLWYDARQPSQPLLQIQHNKPRNDPSWSLSILDTRRLLLSSPTVSYNTIFTLGIEANLPISQHDPYMVDVWPNAQIQSQLARKTSRGYDLWISTVGDGLFKQSIGRFTHKPADLPADPPLKDYKLGTPDFTYFNVPENSIQKKTKMMETFLEIPEPEENAVETPIYPLLGFRTQTEFEDYNQDIWLKQHFKEFREPFVQQIAHDMSNISLAYPESSLEPPEVADFVLQAVADWPEPSIQEEATALPTSDFEPTQADAPSSEIGLPDFAFSQAQPARGGGGGGAFSMAPFASQQAQFPASQPVLSRAKLSQSKKKKRKRTRDGFA